MMQKQLRNCPFCNSAVPVTAKFCIKCGQKLPPALDNDLVKKCFNCDTVLRPGDRFCFKCGFPISTKQEQKFAVFLAPKAEPKTCNICFKKIEQNLTFCPSCLHAFHIPHLYSWVKKNGTCPLCKNELIIQE